jgi:hypothetical protein
MAVQPFAFGVRLRDGERTVRVRIHSRDPDRYVVEDSRSLGKTRQREHKSLAAALRDAASTWRGRLH